MLDHGSGTIAQIRTSEVGNDVAIFMSEITWGEIGKALILSLSNLMTSNKS